jgi:hypothetical protein
MFSLVTDAGAELDPIPGGGEGVDIEASIRVHTKRAAISTTQAGRSVAARPQRTDQDTALNRQPAYTIHPN